MAKINARLEKRERNAVNALKYKVEEKDKDKRKSKWRDWCRTEGHLPSCKVSDCPGSK